MSRIDEEGNASSNKAPVEGSIDPIQEKRQNDESQSDSGKTHEDRKLTTDTESFMERWLRSVWIKKGSSLHSNLMNFLTIVGVGDEESLEALATSFNEIVHMIGDEFNAFTLMKLRNSLWHSTGLPNEMKKETTIADMLFLMKHKDAKGNMTHRLERVCLPVILMNVNHWHTQAKRSVISTK